MILSSILYYLFFSGLFYLSFKLLFAGFSFHRINRLLLLFSSPLAIGIALIAPKFTFPWSRTQVFNFQLPEILIEGKNLNEQLLVANDSFILWQPIYFIGIIGSVLYFLSGIYYISKLAKDAEPREILEHKILCSDKIKNPFCLGKWVFIPTPLLKSKNLELIVQHELYHSSLKHHYDRFYFKLISTLLWFDPILYLMAKELRQVHEFEVDALMIKAENIENYAHLLLSSTLGGDLAYPEKAIAPSPFFNSSLIKTRITMLYQKESPQWKKSIYLVVLPLIATMTLIACNQAEDDMVSHDKKVDTSVSVDQIDQFPVALGCDDSKTADEMQSCAIQAINSYIMENFKYPKLAEELGLEGTLYVSFMIDQNGAISDAEIARSIEVDTQEEKEAVYQAEKETLALVASIPKFVQAAQKDGKSVNLRVVLPVRLKLS